MLWEFVIGDQSVLDHQEISFLFFEEADKCVRGGLEFLCELGGLRCGLGELVSLRVYGTRESEGL